MIDIAKVKEALLREKTKHGSPQEFAPASDPWIIIEALGELLADHFPESSWQNIWPLGTYVEKSRGSMWRGYVRGYYSTSYTPRGYVVESIYETGSVQLYPEHALDRKLAPKYEE
jgi:dihydrofolate reductase (trimethoprim resistance protein)